VRNTVLLGFYSLALWFPAPIILSLLINELRYRAFKKVTQTISYMPHFLSTVIIVGILKDLTSITSGKINEVIKFFGGKPIHFFVEPEWFRFLYIFSGIWQNVGFRSIIFLAALAGVDVALYEAAVIDGAGRGRQLWHITLPSILPTIVILFILNVGQIVSTDFTKVLLMYGPSTWETADVIGTYIYRAGIEGGSLSYSTAVGLVLAVVAFVLLYLTNKLSKSVSDIYLW
jgi:putative aldouronate transport system permease protein